MKPKIVSEGEVTVKGLKIPCYTLQDGTNLVKETVIWQLMNLMERMGVQVELSFEEVEPITESKQHTKFDRALIGLMRVTPPRK